MKYVRRNLWPRIRVVNRASSSLQTPYPLSTRRWNLPFSSSSTSSSWSAYRLTKRRQSASGEHSQGPRPDSVKSPGLYQGRKAAYQGQLDRLSSSHFLQW